MSNFQSFQDAMKVVEKHQQKLPVDVDIIAGELKIKVYRQEGWPDQLCGKIIRDGQHGGESGYAIYINQDHSKKRQRFTLAHEIAHYILHRDSVGDGIADDALYRSGLSNSQESMANKLAADILMPWALVNEQIQSGKDTVEKLADAFDVSTSAMAIRLGIPSQAD